MVVYIISFVKLTFEIITVHGQQHSIRFQLTNRCSWQTVHFLSSIPPHNKVVGGYTGFTPSVRLSARGRMPWPLCNIYSYGWIFFILGTNDQYHKRVCPAPWPLTLNYIFKVIQHWLRKACLLCSVYSSGWILFIFGTQDYYH